VWGGHAGKGIRADSGVRLGHTPGRGWRIEDGVYFGYGTILDITPGAELHIGARTKVMHHVVIGASHGVRIGCDSQIAESSSVRDSDHMIDSLDLMIEAPVVSRPVSIGDDVWIARGVAVLSGSRIGDGAVIAANSVVRGSIDPYTVAAGAPAVPKRQRRRGFMGI
jgi:acetyltransferase-like isoleucine patch superfamily enzyme